MTTKLTNLGSMIAPHSSSHEDGGADEVSIAALSGEGAALAAHKVLDTGVHGAGGDALATDADIATHAAISDSHHTPPTLTKERFTGHMEDVSNLTDTAEYYANDGDSMWFNFQIPTDWSAITSLVAIAVCVDASVANADFDLSSDYGAAGEAYNNHSEADNAYTKSYTQNQLFEIDLSSVLSSAAAGDYCGVKVINNSGERVYFLGLKFKYA